MIRKLVLPILAAALLGGCVTDYAYRGGDRGDYYYGQPTTEYRYYGPYGGYGPHGFGSFGYGYGYPHRYYGYPFGYRGFYHYPPYYRHYHRPPVTWRRPDGSPTPQQRSNNDGRPPWRNFDELRRRQSADGGGTQPREVVPAGPAVAPRQPREDGSRMEQVIRRANRNADNPPAEQEP
ncbi:MAG: hypothetical protein ACREPE_02345 [Lysobacter sp.]